MADFVIRRWDLEPYLGDQAPPHVHHRSDEAFCVLRGELEVLVGSTRHGLTEGDHILVPAGTVHTFATVGTAGAQILVVMTEEIDELVAALHAASSDEEREAVWSRYHSSLVDLPPPG
jgi:mannose-6-phosphate isomerase-like protein (cupin superfamily)